MTDDLGPYTKAFATLDERDRLREENRRLAASLASYKSDEMGLLRDDIEKLRTAAKLAQGALRHGIARHPTHGSAPKGPFQALPCETFQEALAALDEALK